ncbi:hypothetical protein M758_3G115100 [Ceratodon purpureus]|uniref:Uncharacterized protein n=1 Tax=Ceratodon purpureus TaxID=3225 RepID=A0A8T0IJV6_CERPU|nr:hypothetical protein KC19_3G113800 [Ceratodon purpureus]KAG0622674.1 hypothetical protein M758_3G115100 [Ceratodon purpureus]
MFALHSCTSLCTSLICLCRAKYCVLLVTGVPFLSNDSCTSSTPDSPLLTVI